MMERSARVLVTGATGYIGGRLVPRLLEAGCEVVCLARSPAKLDHVWWRDQVDVRKGDLVDASSLAGALDRCDYAFYLVHSMEQKAEDFEQRDREAAYNFAAAAGESGLRRIVYLGGLGEGELSPHLASRQEVGRILSEGSVPVTELRAAVIIGSGSVSFEMLRYLTEVLPVMITPKWVRTRCQPLAIADLLDILVGALDDEGTSVVREIGGPDPLSYEQMMRVYAEVAGLPRRWILAVPALTPRLSSLWIGLVTPLPTAVAGPLVDSLRVEVVVRDNSYAEEKANGLTSYRNAVSRALHRVNQREIPTRWSGVSGRPALPYPTDPEWSGGTVETDVQKIVSSASADDVFGVFSSIGGDIGYFTMNWAWGVRGLMDALAGGVGLRRGRRHPYDLRIGESVDFWRVVHVVPGSLLELYAEMKLPGEAWLSFHVEDVASGSVLTQTALFRPRGLLGRIYWWAMLPFHALIFGRMARRIAHNAEENAGY